MSAVTQATAQALQTGMDPNVLSFLHQTLGSQDYIGLCEKFVEQVTQGKSGLYSSAINAWNQQQNKAVADPNLTGIQPGDAVYFGADSSNNGDGHTGIYIGNGQFISATDNGVKQTNLGDWINQTGQKLLGYIPHAANQMGNLLGQAGGWLKQAGNWWSQNINSDQARQKAVWNGSAIGLGLWGKTPPPINSSEFQKSYQDINQAMKMGMIGGDMMPVNTGGFGEALSPTAQFAQSPTPGSPVTSTPSGYKAPDTSNMSVENNIEQQGGWQQGLRAKFDTALFNKDAATVRQLLPSVPPDYAQRFGSEISQILQGSQ